MNETREAHERDGQHRAAADSQPLQARQDESAVPRGWRPEVDGSPRVIGQGEQLGAAFGASAMQRKVDETNRTGMPDGLKAGVEALSGIDLSDVRVHANSDRPAQLNAAAYAQGSDIHLGPGQEEHLPHEAWHVVQQRQGRVQPTMALGGVGVNDDKGLEHEADEMGRQAAQLRAAPASAERDVSAVPGSPSAAVAVQRKGHKPRDGAIVRYPARGPGEGDEYRVLSAYDDGRLQLRKVVGNNQVNKDWKTDDIWLVYADDPKDSDRRQSEDDWSGLSKAGKRDVYQAAKEEAVGKIKASVVTGMLNETNKDNLRRNLTLGMFNKVRKGEWVATWDESGKAPRKWQFTIDMDRPLDTSWQEPHVGWEVKLLDRGTNHADVPHPAFPKEQGHIWLNDVPEARGE